MKDDTIIRTKTIYFANNLNRISFVKPITVTDIERHLGEVSSRFYDDEGYRYSVDLKDTLEIFGITILHYIVRMSGRNGVRNSEEWFVHEVDPKRPYLYETRTRK